MRQEKISIIIPNFNCEKYLISCFDSIYTQNYSNFEVIVIDDGSTDHSVSIIKDYMKEKENMQLIEQPNMNASVARNKGIEVSSGNYLLFLDSDDILLPNCLEILMKKMIEEEADLIIGDYIIIDEKSKEIKKNQNDKMGIFEQESVLELANLSPVPSNKLFKKSVLRENQIYFANVNIGQDLNFYLKYLGCSKKVLMIQNNIYGHRIVKSGMTFSVNFKILDIVKVFEDVRKFYKKIGQTDLEKKYIAAVEFKHYFWQMNKQIKFPKYRERKMIVDYFVYHIDKIDFSRSVNKDFIKRDKRIYNINRITKALTCSKIYSWLFKKMLAKRNINF